MSSTMSEIRTLSAPQPFPRKTDKGQRLVRTSSLEKIRRFNSFICSQQYYVLPALLAWLRSSQSVLQSSTEKTIFFFRSLIFSHFLYKICQVEFRALAGNAAVVLGKQMRTTVALKLAVYATAMILMTELGMCFYLLSSTHVPSGLVFLIVSWFYIIYLNIKSVYFSREKSDDKKRN